MSRTVIIDGDILVYRVSEALTENWDLESEEDEEFVYQTISWGNKAQAENQILKMIEDIKKKTKSKEYIICLSDTENFRKELNPNYKGNRKSVKPVLWKFLREYIREKHPSLMCKQLEADDVIGILATSKKLIQGERVIWSLDKDFKTIPCVFFRGDEKPVKITEAEADWWFMYQTLIGDSTDGYKGCKGIGDKTARKILGKIGENSCKKMWNLVKNSYEKMGFTEEEALLNARMARILRKSDYDFKNKKVKLWNDERNNNDNR